MQRTEPYLFMLPVLLSLGLIYLYPMVSSIFIAFSNYKLSDLDNVYFNGLENFKDLFNDPNVGIIARNTLFYVVTTVSLQFLLGLILALVLKKPFRGRGLVQGIVFLPWAMSSFVVGLIFRWSFNGEYGVVNYLLEKIGLISEKISWLGTDGLSLLVIILAVVWMGVPFFGIMYLAALQSVPEEMYESASIDGCGKIKSFFLITIPYIKPIILTTLLLRTIWVFNTVDMIVVVSGGGPAYSSEILASYLYSKAYLSNDFGIAAALGLLFIIGMLIFACVYLKLTKSSKDGE